MVCSAEDDIPSSTSRVEEAARAREADEELKAHEAKTAETPVQSAIDLLGRPATPQPSC